MSKADPHSNGIDFCSLLTIVFIVLKLTGVIGWSWWWVLAPIWVTWTLVLLFIAGVGLAVMVSEWRS